MHIKDYNLNPLKAAMKAVDDAQTAYDRAPRNDAGHFQNTYEGARLGDNLNAAYDNLANAIKATAAVLEE